MAALSEGLMSKRNRSKSTKSRGASIGDLPDEVLLHIISFLPSETAVKTSVLSKRWKILWTSCFDLDFNLKELHPTLADEKKFVDRINTFMKFHSVPKINRFRLVFSHPQFYISEVENWIHWASKKKVEELDLNFGVALPEKDYTKGSFLTMTCKSFKSLTSLKTLSLGMMTINEELIQALILESPLLETLSMRKCSFSERNLCISARDLRLTALWMDGCIGLGSIEIYAPNLVSFNYNGYPLQFHFKNISSLAYALFGFPGWAAFDHLYSIVAPSLQFLLDHSNLRSLSVLPSFVQYIKRNDERCPSYRGSSNLRILRLQHSVKPLSLSSFLYFLTKFTELEKVSIDTNPFSIPYELKRSNPGVFHNLKTIELKLTGDESETEMVRFLLKEAIVLETLLLLTRGRRRTVQLKEQFNKILFLPRTSLCAKIVFM